MTTWNPAVLDRAPYRTDAELEALFAELALPRCTCTAEAGC